jgi:hypothetical protein
VGFYKIWWLFLGRSLHNKGSECSPHRTNTNTETTPIALPNDPRKKNLSVTLNEICWAHHAGDLIIIEATTLEPLYMVNGQHLANCCWDQHVRLTLCTRPNKFSIVPAGCRCMHLYHYFRAYVGNNTKRFKDAMLSLIAPCPLQLCYPHWPWISGWHECPFGWWELNACDDTRFKCRYRCRQPITRSASWKGPTPVHWDATWEWIATCAAMWRERSILTNYIHTTTLAMLNIEPPGPKNGGSIADAPINSVQLLGMLHTVDLICWPQPRVVQ